METKIILSLDRCDKMKRYSISVFDDDSLTLRIMNLDYSETDHLRLNLHGNKTFMSLAFMPAKEWYAVIIESIGG